MIEIKKTTLKKLTRDQVFRLMGYGEEYGKFVALLDRNVLFVNRNISEEDIQRFLEIAESTEEFINEPGGPHENTLEYIYKRYPAVYSMLQDHHQKKIDRLCKKAAEEKVAALLPKIHSFVHEIEDDPLDRHIVSAVFSEGLKSNSGNSSLSVSSRLIFYLGYLLGTGEISREEAHAAI